ncbi:hypothetical protein DPD44_20945 [Salmonella enterica subsp. enterica serovar Poona]|nr:hypothetical protein [Salmonella enterica subsp. enterica serovar Poona]
MKKTLIALVVAASAATSGSAMAWTANGSGGSVEVGGSLTPVTKVTPWEVATGATVTNADAQVQKAQSSVQVNVAKSIPVLAIRSTATDGFAGKAGISPQIGMPWIAGNNWNNANNGINGTVNVLDDAGAKIGKAVLMLQAVGVSSSTNASGANQRLLFANASGQGYYGGLPTSRTTNDIRTLIKAAWPDIDSKYIAFPGSKWVDPAPETFTDSKWKFSSYYGSVIPVNSKINITLDTPATGDAPIKWKINLPVAVTYQ